MQALLAHEVPSAHSFRHRGNAWCAPPEDAHFRVRTIGWWGMTETVTHGIVGLCGFSNAPHSMGRPAPEYPTCPNSGDLLCAGRYQPRAAMVKLSHARASRRLQMSFPLGSAAR